MIPSLARSERIHLPVVLAVMLDVVGDPMSQARIDGSDSPDSTVRRQFRGFVPCRPPSGGVEIQVIR